MTSCLRIRKRNLLRRLKQKIYFFKTFFKKIRRPADNLQDAVFFFIRNADPTEALISDTGLQTM